MAERKPTFAQVKLDLMAYLKDAFPEFPFYEGDEDENNGVTLGDWCREVSEKCRQNRYKKDNTHDDCERWLKGECSFEALACLHDFGWE